ncbi:BC1881 family protein [Paenibacillus polymyxa]|uniref:BC1881 family protein n=1 Tax=Paenibacillus polymyxa TaxID=1406 RepID=UPI000CEB0298|nr:BC1881 family protein [Paenibacillus polymyxa]
MIKSTKELSEELQKREGVRTVKVQPHEEFKIIANQKEIILSGPAIIMINQD